MIWKDADYDTFKEEDKIKVDHFNILKFILKYCVSNF